MRGAIVRARMSLATMLASCAMLLVSASVALGHPLHTTITEIGYRPGSRALRATIRVFADDFGRAVLGLSPSAAAPGASAVGDSAAAAYVRRHFTIATREGRVLPLRWCGMRRSGDLVWICVETPWQGSASGLRLENAMLFELYRDQINIVQADVEGARASVLFTRGDGAKTF